MNQEADDLSNGRTVGFDPALRVAVDLKHVEWRVLNRLFEEGAEFYAQTASAKRARRTT